MKERVIPDLRTKDKCYYLRIKKTHRNIRKLLQIYKEYEKDNHNIYMYKLGYLKSYWKNMYKEMNKYKRTTIFGDQHPLKVFKYIYIMMDACLYYKPIGCRSREVRTIKHISKQDETLIRYVIKNFGYKYPDNIPF